uniref:Uncharacterized protein n=1 Tax=Mycena chlorophos TaxID=658473 RepID=A0ABQ0L919_MYCCL|nr:predicted protein [Mycena chlorophos]
MSGLGPSLRPHLRSPIPEHKYGVSIRSVILAQALRHAVAACVRKGCRLTNVPVPYKSPTSHPSWPLSPALFAAGHGPSSASPRTTAAQFQRFAPVSVSPTLDGAATFVPLQAVMPIQTEVPNALSPASSTTTDADADADSPLTLLDDDPQSTVSLPQHRHQPHPRSPYPHKPSPLSPAHKPNPKHTPNPSPPVPPLPNSNPD